MINKKSKIFYTDLSMYRLSSILLGSIAIGIIVPIIIASGYSFYIADDFHNAVHDGVDGNNLLELFIPSVNYAIGIFRGWQGTWFSSFLLGFLSPLNGYGIMQLRIVMLLNAIAIVASICILVYVICKKIMIQKEVILIAMAVCIIEIFWHTSWFEIFYWFTGAMVYGFPMALGLLGIALALKAKKTIGIFFSAILVFAACGGSIAIAGVVCFILLSICIINIVEHRKEKKQYVIFCVAFIGALLNAMAPGNYIRHAVIDDTGIHFGKAVVLGFSEIFAVIKGLMGNPLFPLIVGIMLIAGVNISTKKTIKSVKILLVAVMLAAVAPLSAAFPLCLGYGTNAWIPNRCKFIETIIVIFSIMTIAVIIGYLIGKKFYTKFQLNRILELVNLLAVIVVILLIPKSVSYEMWGNIAKGAYKNYYEDINVIYSTIESENNTDVFIYEKPQEIAGFAVVDLSEDMSYWVNLGIAKYYSKESVQYVSAPVFINGNGDKIVRISDNIFKNKTGYVSINKKDEISQDEENIVSLDYSSKNYVINCKDGQGKIILELFEDDKGHKKLEEQVIEY